MAGSGAPLPSKKSVGFELNLVPFIDLMSVMISFLLITAVWTQIARIEAHAAPTEAGDEQPNPAAPSIDVHVRADGQAVVRLEGEVVPGDLGTALQSARAASPDSTLARVTSDDGVLYARLIEVMDTISQEGLRDLQVVVAGEY